MFSLLGTLKILNEKIVNATLGGLFQRLDVDERNWRLLLRSELPATDYAIGVERLRDTIFEFVKRLNRKQKGRLASISDNNPVFTDDVNFAHRIYLRADALYVRIVLPWLSSGAQVFGHLRVAEASTRGGGRLHQRTQWYRLL